MTRKEEKRLCNTIIEEIEKFAKRSKFIAVRRKWDYGFLRVDLEIVENKLNTKVPTELLNYLKSFCKYCEDEREMNLSNPAIWLKNYKDWGGCVGYVDENNIIHFYENEQEEEEEDLFRIEFCIVLN